jgi:hypothetical protein
MFISPKIKIRLSFALLLLTMGHNSPNRSVK